MHEAEPAKRPRPQALHHGASHQGPGLAPALQDSQQMTQLAAINSSPVMSRQSALAGMIHDSQRQAAQRKILSAIQSSGSAGVAQREAVAGNIVGITHLVKIKGRSIFRGEEAGEVQTGTQVLIETDDHYRSRRGPNQEVFNPVDEVGEHKYHWFRVTHIDGQPAAAGTYIRSGTFTAESDSGIESLGENAELRGRDPDAVPAGRQGKANEEESKAILENHEVSDEDDLSFMYENVAYASCPVLVDKRSGKSTLPLLRLGRTLCRADNGDIFYVSQQMVRSFWESYQVEEGNPNLGSFSSGKGFTPHPILGPDARYNCAAWAHGTWQWIEPENMHAILRSEYDKLDSHTSMLVGPEYMVAQQFHFIRAWKLGEDAFRTSEKNGPSAVYEKIHTATDFMKLCDPGSGRGVYRKK